VPWQAAQGGAGFSCTPDAETIGGGIRRAPNSAEAAATRAATPSPVVERQRGRGLLGALTAQVAARRADGSGRKEKEGGGGGVEADAILWNLMVSHFAPTPSSLPFLFFWIFFFI